MHISLTKKPKNPAIIIGFPGFGLVGTIASEFLIDHLDTEKIGKIWFSEIPPMIAVHQGKLVEPIGIFYNKKYNIVIIHAVTTTAGLEWKLSKAIVDIAQQLKPREIICLEGIGTTTPSKISKAYFYCSHDKKSLVLKKTGLEQLKEGIIMGLTGLLLLRVGKDMPICSIFAETHSQLPDSNAAAKLIETLDKYLNLKIDYKPLLKQAEKFEEKLKDIVKKTQDISEEQEKKKLSYVG